MELNLTNVANYSPISQDNLWFCQWNVWEPLVKKSDWNLAEIFYKFLEVFYDVTKLLSGVYYLTTHLALNQLFNIACTFQEYRYYEIFSIIPFNLNNVKLISYLLEFITNLNGIITNSYISTIDYVNTAFNPIIPDQNFTNFLQIEAIGQALYSVASYWLIITSVILLLSMISPIFISRKNSSN